MESHKNVIQAATGHLAAIGLQRTGKTVLGSLISPATWFYNWVTTGTLPTSVDYGFWILSIGGGMFGPASLAATYVKALVDDDIHRKVLEARSSEPPHVRPGIHALIGWGTPSGIGGRLAVAGGTAWQHPNGVWVGLVDDRRRPVSNYSPKLASDLRRPVWPLTAGPGGGRYMIHDKLSNVRTVS